MILLNMLIYTKILVYIASRNFKDNYFEVLYLQFY